MIANIASPFPHRSNAKLLPYPPPWLSHFTETRNGNNPPKPLPFERLDPQQKTNSGCEYGSHSFALQGRRTGGTMNRKRRKLKIHKIGSLAGMFNFNADHFAGSIEIEHKVGRDLLRVSAGAVLQLNIKRVGVGKIFESHG